MARAVRRRVLGWMIAIVTACGCAPRHAPGHLRFADREPIWEVNDTRLIPKPAEIPYWTWTKTVDLSIREPVLDTWSVPGPTLAQNINALGGVPDSTWFENRIGIDAVTPEELWRGPLGGQGPDRSEPWTVKSTKTGGKQPGLDIVDASGARYLLKFDPPDAPELETGTDAVVSRLLWATGYHVPGDAVVYFDRDDLVLAPDATQQLPDGTERPLTEQDLDALLAERPAAENGAGYRGLTSRFLPGVPVGGHPMQGVREDDPNDRVPHQHRRDIRAQWVFFGWLQHTDVKQDNTLDMWIEQEEGRGYLMHYLVDFGRALGAKGYDGRMEHDGWTHHVDYAYGAASIFTLGMWKRPWEGAEPSELRGVGRFDAEHFRPDRFRTSIPYPPFWRTDRFDAYWASTILMHFTRAHIEAAVAAGRFSDPRTERYLARVLLERRDKIARHWFDRVAPIDELVHDERGLCAADLAIRHGFHAARASSYRAQAYDFAGRALGELRVRQQGAELCVELDGVRPRRRDYLMVWIRTRRSGRALPPTTVHLARLGAGAPLRVVGVDRR